MFVVRSEVEVVEGLDAWQSGFVDAPGAASFVADVEFDLEGFGEERRVRETPAGGFVAELVEGRCEAGERAVGGRRRPRSWCR